MTLDTQIRRQLASAVEDTTVPPGLARTALSGGRRRRRRRTTGGLALLTAAVVGGAFLVPSLGAPPPQPYASNGGALADPAAFRWAGTLTDGPAAAIPYFAYGRLWSGGASVGLPDSVDVSVGPWAVDGGWIVLTGRAGADMRLAVLGPQGRILATLPEGPGGLGDAISVDVSADGTQVAYNGLLVDLPTMDTTELPNSLPGLDDGTGSVRPRGFTAQGLVYEAAPYAGGVGTTYVLRPDGSAVAAPLPEKTHIPDNSPGDVAVGFDYTADEPDTCVTSYHLSGSTWVEDGTGCMGQYLEEALAVSPDGRWLLTDDLPRVWDLQEGEFVSVDIPRKVVASRAPDLVGGIVWETDDTFLLPVADRTSQGATGRVDFDQFVRVVRCRISTGACELANLIENRVVVDGTTSTEFRFPTR